MLLHLMLSIQLLLTMAVMPDKIFKRDMKDNIPMTEISMEPVGDNLTTMIQRYAAYNHWANQQFADWLGWSSPNN